MEAIKTQKKLISLSIFLFLALSAILVSSYLKNSPSSLQSRNHHSFIKKACSETLYSALCHSTFPASANFTNFLDFALNRTVSQVKIARGEISAHFNDQDLNTRQKDALHDCMEMLDQTVYELKRAVHVLASSRSSHRSYGDVKTLLSAAMTNGNTCIDGFFDLDRGEGTRESLQNLLTPISQMISNSLALIRHVENRRLQETVKKPVMMTMTSTRAPAGRKVPNRVRIFRRKEAKIATTLRPHVTVSSDGSGNYTIIGDAIAMAPNMSKSSYIIKVKAGIYRENIVIPRLKINIMLIGDGMNKTIITGSRNFKDGFSTFQSATLTVIGDKFMARDLTIENSSAPEKHQAVALRVTSNAAFSRCRIASHQDTLYAHSLRQFYHDCIIQGTIDFIFGNAAALFKNCTILARKPIPGQRNTITAQGREDPNQNTGISLQHCTIEAAGDFDVRERKNFSTYLGRPWRNYSRTVVVNSYLGDLIHPRGWLEWAQCSSVDAVEYIECMNSGPGADTRRRVPWAGNWKNCGELVKRFEVEEFLHGADNWLESTVLPDFIGF